jgi:hypothetical protein
MSKFNSPAEKEITLNHMGAKAFKQTPKQELAMLVLTTFVDNSFYEAKDVKLERLHSLIDEVAKKDPEFVAKLAVYARKEFNMRSVFPVLVGRLTQVHRGDSLVSRAIVSGTTRPDDLTELASYLGLKLTNQAKKGIAKALTKFNSYSLAKYRAEEKTVKMIDLANLVHPKPTLTSAVALKSLMTGTLKNEDTWEARLSAGEDKATVFKDLLLTNKLGYMALLRNLRNIQETGDSELIALASARLTDEEAVRKSKQLPFRFLNAFEALEAAQTKPSGLAFEKDNTQTLKLSVEKALELSIRHLPVFEGETMILSDNSGSMKSSRTSSAIAAAKATKSADIANLFATMMWLKSENTYVGLFGERLISPKMDRSKSFFDNYKILDTASNSCGGATEEGLFTAFEELVKSKRKVARIMIFSDCQVGRTSKWYDSKGRRADHFNALYTEYKKINPDCKIYSVDLTSYGNSMIAEGAMCLAGWSEKIFNIMHKYEIEPNALIKEIENVTL